MSGLSTATASTGSSFQRHPKTPFANVVWKEDQQLNTVGEAGFQKKNQVDVFLQFANCQFVVSSNLNVYMVHML